MCSPSGAGRRRCSSLRFVVIILAAVTVLFAAGCGSEKPGGTLPSVGATTQPPADGFQGDPAFPTPPYVSLEPIELGAVVNLSQVQELTEEQKAVLARQGFVAGPSQGATRFWHVYEDARYRGIPVLVTTDAVLNAFHTVFSTTLHRLEETELLDRAVALSEAMYDASSAQWNDAAAPDVEEAALANMAFFSVSLSLLKGDGIYAPDAVRTEVMEELRLIEAAEGSAISPIFGYEEDYSQYKVRGHYTRSEALGRYFKGMMWFGHPGFFVNPKLPDVNEDLARNLTRRAALMAAALEGEAEQHWLAIYEPTAFLVGTADDLTPADMRSAMQAAWGSDRPDPSRTSGNEAIDDLRGELDKLPAPRILSHQAWGEGSQEEASRSFRLMGQRYIPDSYAFQQLVWRLVGTEDNMRLFPLGLDAMAVLGSDQAYELSVNLYGSREYANWETQLLKVKSELEEGADGLWPDNLYTSWLEALRLTMQQPPEQAPPLMRTKAWARKSLQTALGSWTELRHDTLLYAKQSVIAEGDGGEEQEVVGYVEPYPDVYARLAELAGRLAATLSDYDMLDPISRDKCSQMETLALTLQSIATKQLTGQQLDGNERDAIVYFGSYVENLEYFEDEEGRTLTSTDEKSAVVADVHTDLSFTREVLCEATGLPLALYVVLELEGRMHLLVGACYEYFEFRVPLGNRPTDEEWWVTLDQDDTPPLPEWTREFIVK